MGAGRAFSWGPEAVDASVGRYALCWCIIPLGEDLPRCDVSTGEIVLAGPVTGQSFRTIAGHVGTVALLQGYGLLSNSDSLLAGKSCRFDDPVPGFPNNGIASVVGLA